MDGPALVPLPSDAADARTRYSPLLPRICRRELKHQQT